MEIILLPGHTIHNFWYSGSDYLDKNKEVNMFNHLPSERCKGCEYYSEKVIQNQFSDGVYIHGEYFKPEWDGQEEKEYCLAFRLHFAYVERILEENLCHKYIPKIISKKLNIPERR